MAEDIVLEVDDELLELLTRRAAEFRLPLEEYARQVLTRSVEETQKQAEVATTK